MEIKEFIVTNEEKNLRLDVYLQKKLNKLSRSYIKQLIEKKQILINEKLPQKSGVLIKSGDKIIVHLLAPEKPNTLPENIDLDIIYQDEDLAVINKQQGLVVHAGAGNFRGTLVNALLYHIKDLSGINGVLRAGIVHRLDKNTSGLLLIAKNDFAHKILASQIENKICERKYLSILDGVVKDDEGIIETQIGRNPKNRKLMSVVDSDKGKKAITLFKVLERFDKHCLIEFSLKTGRTHQIRVHCKEVLHHSITGDLEYGGKKPVNLPKTAHQSLGQYLHAYKISFFHPRTNQQLSFQAPLPDYFLDLLNFLKKQNNR